MATYENDDNEDDAYEFENVEGIKNTPNLLAVGSG